MKMLARLASILSTILIIGCQPNGLSPTEKRLTSTVAHTDGSDSTVYSTYKYDLDGRLISLVDSMSIFNQAEIHFFYDADNRVRAAYEYSPRFSNPITSFLDSFIYDGNGRIKEMQLKHFQGDIFYHRLLAYDDQGRLIADTARANGPDYFSTLFNYDGADNIVSTWSFSIHGNTIDTSQIWHATYTNIENPYGNMGLMFYLIGWDMSALSKHAIATYTPPAPSPQGDFGGPRTYSYELYPNGLVKTITAIEGGRNSYISHTDFYYE